VKKSAVSVNSLSRVPGKGNLKEILNSLSRVPGKGNLKEIQDCFT